MGHQAANENYFACKTFKNDKLLEITIAYIYWYIKIRKLKSHHFNAILIGVVKHEVNRAAGRSGFIGRIWWAVQAASWMQFLKLGGGVDSLFWWDIC